jgi:cytochrome c oxidase assembly protein subunit 11
VSENLGKRNIRSALKPAFIACLMFGFGYALVPLYDIFCEVTGFGGRTDTITQTELNDQNATEIDPNRLVRVQFSATVATPLPWDFKAEVFQQELKMGELYEFFYVAKNNGLSDITAQSTFNVTPAQAGGYIKKLECFCFTQQTLEAGEERRMPVRLMVDPNLPLKINELTLGYSFFQLKNNS